MSNFSFDRSYVENCNCRTYGVRHWRIKVCFPFAGICPLPAASLFFRFVAPSQLFTNGKTFRAHTTEELYYDSGQFES